MRERDVPMRSSVLRGLPALINDAGGRGRDFLSGHGISEELVARHNAFVSARLVERILEDAAGRFAIPDLGLRIAGQQDPHILGPLAIAMENSRTIGDALECANRFLFVLSPALSQTLIPDPRQNSTMVGIQHANSLGITSAQFVDYGIGMAHRVVTLVNGGRPYGLRSVWLPHPPLAPAPTYRAHFGAEVSFNRPHAVLRVPLQLLSVPISGGNDLLREIALDFLETHFGHEVTPVSELVTTILRGNPGPDRPDLPKVARILSLHPRSLQRQLAEEGTKFKELLDRVRRDQARDLIVNSNLSLSQIAVRVGLREQSSLTHAVQRWFGVAPSSLRRTAGGSPGGALGQKDQALPDAQ